MSRFKPVEAKAKKARSGGRAIEFGKVAAPISFDAVEYLPRELIRRYAGNPRNHPERQIHALAQSIAGTGLIVPLLVDATNMLIAGEARLDATELLNLNPLPVLRVEGLTPAQVKGYRLADNRIAELGTWDEKLLAIELKELSSMDLGFNIEALGWDLGVIDIKIDSLNEAVDGESDPADILPTSGTFAVTRLGDVWLCGEHRVTCGSCLEAPVYQRLMKGRRAQMSFQDPPYNVSVTKHVGGLGKIQHREFAMASGEMSEGEFATFLTDELRLTTEHCEPGAVIAAFMDWRGIDKLIGAGKGLGLELINLCVWNKTNASMGSLYRSKHELVAIFKKPGATHRNNVQLGRYGRYRTNVWDAAGCNAFGPNRMEELGSHPTVKPVQLVADAIRDVSHRGEIILDSFLGSGTTMIAAERAGRIAYGIELDPLHVDTAIRRWEQFTGAEATLEATGQSFAETMAERESEPTAAIMPRARKRSLTT